jgi:hypothetical protein
MHPPRVSFEWSISLASLLSPEWLVKGGLDSDCNAFALAQLTVDAPLQILPKVLLRIFYDMQLHLNPILVD